MQKKLNLFIIAHSNNLDNKSISYHDNLNLNIIRYLNISNFKEIKAYINLFKCMLLLKKLNKTIFIYSNNLITIIYRNSMYSNMIVYKFDNIQNPIVTKLYKYMEASVFVNISPNYLKFKSEHERLVEFHLDCYHSSLRRKKVETNISKMFLLAMYNMI